MTGSVSFSRFWRTGVALVSALLLPAATLAAKEFESAEALLECAAANAPRADEVRSLRLTARDRLKRERTTRLNVFARGDGDAVLLRFIEPAPLAGSALLVVREAESQTYFLHTAGIATTRRVDGRELAGSLFGTDFSVEDMVRFQGLSSWGNAKLVSTDHSVGGRAVVVLEGTPSASHSAYSRVVARFDAERCVPLEIEMYDGGEAPRKRMVTEAVTRVGERWIGERAILYDDRDGTQTEVALLTVFEQLDIPARAFEPQHFGFEAPRLELTGPERKPVVQLERVQPAPPGP